MRRTPKRQAASLPGCSGNGDLRKRPGGGICPVLPAGTGSEPVLRPAAGAAPGQSPADATGGSGLWRCILLGLAVVYAGAGPGTVSAVQLRRYVFGGAALVFNGRSRIPAGMGPRLADNQTVFVPDIPAFYKVFQKISENCKKILFFCRKMG